MEHYITIKVLDNLFPQLMDLWSIVVLDKSSSWLTNLLFGLKNWVALWK